MTHLLSTSEEDFQRRERGQEYALREQRGKLFREVTPIPPIPPRASANLPGVVRVRPRYPRTFVVTEEQEDDVTRIPTVPQPTQWRHESPTYESESSLPLLSLIASEQVPVSLPISPTIDELDTLPYGRMLSGEGQVVQNSPVLESAGQIQQRVWDIADRETDPPGNRVAELSPLLDVETLLLPSLEAGKVPRTLLQVPTAFAESEAVDLHFIDRLRWWLLYPGRLEFLCWLTGTFLLMCFTMLIAVILVECLKI